MFGAKIRNWVEAHFVRHRKKRSKEAKNKEAPSAEAPSKSSPSAHTDPGPSTSVHTAICHHNPATSSSTQTTKRVTLVSPTLSCKFSYTDENTESPKRPTLHAAINNNNNNKLGARYSSYLSSPESAYSTGYSTDATSPYEPSIDATLSPEYYINIRTGTRYFQSVDVDLRSRNETLKTFGSGQISQRVDLISKREDCNRGSSGLRSFGATPPQPPPRKSSIPDSIFAQTDKHRASPIKQINCKSSQTQQFCNSPRQRCRIRTNPWLSSASTSDTNLNAVREVSKSGPSAAEPAVPLTPLNEDVSTAATIGSWHVADSTTTCDEESCDDEDEEVFLKEKPVRRRTVAASKKKSSGAQALKKRGSFSSDSTLLSTPSISRCSSVEDATLNELGRFDESYTYDKETDILSDSDATDCEVDDTTVTSRTLNEQSTSTTHTICEVELDYIDVGEQCDTQVVHREAHCTYHLSYNQSEFRHLNSSAASSKMKRASQRRNRSRIESPALQAVNGVPSPALRHRAIESPAPKGIESPLQRARQVQSPCLRNKRVESKESLRSRGIESPSLRNRVLAERRLESGGSSNSTPLIKRRTPIGSNCSTPQATRHVPFAKSESTNSTPVRKAPIDLPLKRTEDNKSKSLAPKYSESERKLIEADKEADRKYRQLIKEAESLLVHMRNVTVEEVDLETPTVEVPEKPFPQQQLQVPQPRPDPARLSIKIQKPSGAAPAYPSVTVTTPSGGPPRALVTFRSVDLNSPVASEAPYCPQSEPVKRKVYSSAALQRLQEHFKLTEMDESSDSSPPEADENSSADQGTSKSNLSTCEYGTQEERRKRRQEARTQYKLAVARRNNVLSILEELKLDLQVQSARLHDTYRSTNDLRSPCLGDVTPSPIKANVTFGPLNIFSPIRRATNSVTKSPKHH